MDTDKCLNIFINVRNMCARCVQVVLNMCARCAQYVCKMCARCAQDVRMMCARIVQDVSGNSRNINAELVACIHTIPFNATSQNSLHTNTDASVTQHKPEYKRCVNIYISIK